MGKKVKQEEVISEASEAQNEEELTLASLFEGSEYSEEFKEKATTIFEAAVSLKVNEIAESLDEKFEEEILAKTEEITTTLSEKVESYLNVMVAEWIEENRVAVESGLKQEIFEGFINGMKTLFKESYIEIPEEKMNLVEDLEAKISALQEQLNASVENRAALSKQIDEMSKVAVIKDSMEGLTDLDAEKLKGLAEGMDFENADKFKAKLQVIKESFFANAPSKEEVKAVVTDAPVVIEESINNIQEATKVLDKDVESFVKALSTIKF